MGGDEPTNDAATQSSSPSRDSRRELLSAASMAQQQSRRGVLRSLSARTARLSASRPGASRRGGGRRLDGRRAALAATPHRFSRFLLALLLRHYLG
eukprot:CAMPEP_0119094274 /NCGR_PEP_ID=MMETSP1178-20130426/165765_1 /TAXON_ID=33656 /ORGANISM="unid sp, Strain CCMP2000" /LENGTH=95 /DNA_ID=CAMNT_0007077999 /DNA_START=117 /DNA_END=401 /DNA_ORIENTATION=+